ncbi:hypothetical protein HYR53_10630 [Candidatus Acetothermia bacterium]|nr:hypothetical protein [Candidatus Acetothermia bacterium]
MAQTASRKPKLDLAVNVEESVTLLSSEPYFDVGQYGTWALIAVEHEGVEKTWFPPYPVAIFLKNQCGLGDLLSICKSQEPGERAARWRINGREVPFVRDPAKPENGTSSTERADEAQQVVAKPASQAVSRERVRSIPVRSGDERIKLEALRAAIDLFKLETGAENQDPQRVVEAARLFEEFLRE